MDSDNFINTVKNYYVQADTWTLSGTFHNVGGAVASWLVHSSSDQVVQVQALTGDIVVFFGKTLSQCLVSSV